MIYIKERITKHVPGMTSFFIKIDNKQYLKDIVAQIKTINIYDFNKKTLEWEIPSIYLAELIDKLCIYDDLDLSILKYKEEPDKIYKLSNYKTKPFKYQEEGIQYGLNHDNWLLLDAPGLGKSLQLIYLAEELKKRENIKHCLIVCGVNTLKTNWKKEIQKHSKLDCVILGEKINSKGNISFGSISDRLEQLKNPIKEFFVIVNIESLRDDRIIKTILNGKNKFDMIVVDEIHCCKSNSSQQGKNLLKLSKIKYKIGATGTLLLNSPLDSYVPLKWIGAERAAQSTCKYFYQVYGGQFGKEFLGYRNLDTLKQQLSAYTLRRDKSLLNLPPKNIIEEYVDMSDKQQLFYNNIKSGIKDQIDKVDLKPNIILSMAMRLRQATACPSILTTENIPSAKIDRTCDLVEQITSTGNKVVIFSTFKETVSELEKRLIEYNPLIGTGDIEDEIISKNIDKFQNEEENKIFIGTWQKCGTGFTLTRANYMIFIDTPWTPAQLEQACDRIYRIGTTGAVFIYNLITNNTVDERVLEIVNDKEAVSDYVIDGTITKKSLESLKKYIVELN